MLLMLILSLYGAPRRFLSCNVPAADFFRYVISNLVFEILFSTRANSKRLTDMPMATTSPRLNTQGLSVVVRNFCRGPSSSDTSFRLHGRAVVVGGSRGTASGEGGVVAGASRGTASGEVYSLYSDPPLAATRMARVAELDGLPPKTAIARHMFPTLAVLAGVADYTPLAAKTRHLPPGT